MTEDGTRNLVVDLIGAAVLAGAYLALAREMPEAERGLMKMYEKWHGRTAILAGRVCADAGWMGRASVAMPTTRG